MHRYYDPNLYCLANDTIYHLLHDSKVNYLAFLNTLEFYLTCVLAFTFLLIIIHLKYNKYQSTNLKNKPENIIIQKINDDAKVITKLEYFHLPKIRSKSCFKNFKVSTAQKTDLNKFARIENINSIQQEAVEEYNYGGYMPVTINDIVGGYYKIIRKLGFGYFSTVWLCNDIKTKKYLAIKIIKSSDAFRIVARDEINLLYFAKNQDPSHPGYNKISHLIKDFEAISPNGKHICLAFDVMGPSLLHLITQSNSNGVRLSGVQTIVKQILQGLVYLHEVCGIIHTDIKPENILIECNSKYTDKAVEIANNFRKNRINFPKTFVTSQDWYDICGVEYNEEEKLPDEELKIKMNRCDSYPGSDKMNRIITAGKLTEEVKINKPIWINKDIVVKIADLGNSCFENHHYSENIQTKQYKAPEVLVRAGYSYPADIWSVGCLAYEIATADYLFNPKARKSYGSDEDHLGMIWELFGYIPQTIAQNGKRSHLYFDRKGEFLHIPKRTLDICDLSEILIKQFDLNPEDAIPFAFFLENLINPDPSFRYTATQALNSEWINKSLD